MALQWGNILVTELVFTGSVMVALGFIKLPAYLRRRRLARGFPWGYYPDRIPKIDPGYFSEHDRDFMHDTGASFGGLEGFGDFGEFSGFGEMGEFGNNFGGGGDASGE
ncbi:MAG: hypothetical protein HY711_00690 [Candidatus Melainabacteria bacterium]|nr:hypothetical protein [Candidatus Melainabacteria bacterium]